MRDIGFLFVQIVSVLIDSAAAALVLWPVAATRLGRAWRRARDESPPPPDAPPPRMSASSLISAWRMIGAAIVAAAVFLATLPLLAKAGLNFFGIIRLIYLDLVIATPMLSLVLLVLHATRVRRLTAPACVVAALGCLAAPVGVYATFVEPLRLQERTVSVPVAKARAAGAPVRIGVLADIQTAHVTDYERDAVERLMRSRPDVIVLPGDLFQGSDAEFEREFAALRELLGRMSAPGGAYAVIGNVDRRDRLDRLLPGTPVRLLDNEIARITVRDRAVTIGGVGMTLSHHAAKRTIGELQDAPGDDLRILVAHLPDAALALPRPSRIDLVIAGHTHGGQVCLPWFGPLMTLSQVPREVAAGGLHDLGGVPMFVSRGVGCERGQAPRVRLLCAPEIAVLVVGGGP